MYRRLALLSMFVFFAAAYATQDRMPRSAVKLLRGASEHVAVIPGPEASIGPEM
ncbi:hypothetical protein [Chelatococcus composti]|jgi:hypothetical protein|uniref:Uncharacterized protein n=1 Tax=Chelatococcus composti TaxID=1743235 RepID=A0A841K4K6_9HYPH|nr:hypothetical protein [Chelatococcus composti]MBB6167421.1 hypothetical protein [Chelatococcus composti]MBS7735626.1 hypothetical protein [Chelatococcus composti]GGG31793.1 hypothetical protein GCM10008026_10400 [Chelatococcus composti]